MGRSLGLTLGVTAPVGALRLPLVGNATGILTGPVPWEGGCCFRLFVMMNLRDVKGLGQGHIAASSGPRGNKNAVVCPSHWGYFHSMVFTSPSMMGSGGGVLSDLPFYYLSGNVHLA